MSGSHGHDVDHSLLWYLHFSNICFFLYTTFSLNFMFNQVFHGYLKILNFVTEDFYFFTESSISSTKVTKFHFFNSLLSLCHPLLTLLNDKVQPAIFLLVKHFILHLKDFLCRCTICFEPSKSKRSSSLKFRPNQSVMLINTILIVII